LNKNSVIINFHAVAVGKGAYAPGGTVQGAPF